MKSRFPRTLSKFTFAAIACASFAVACGPASESGGETESNLSSASCSSDGRTTARARYEEAIDIATRYQHAEPHDLCRDIPNKPFLSVRRVMRPLTAALGACAEYRDKLANSPEAAAVRGVLVTKGPLYLRVLEGRVKPHQRWQGLAEALPMTTVIVTTGTRPHVSFEGGGKVSYWEPQLGGVPQNDPEYSGHDRVTRGTFHVGEAEADGSVVVTLDMARKIDSYASNVIKLRFKARAGDFGLIDVTEDGAPRGQTHPLSIFDADCGEPVESDETDYSKWFYGEYEQPALPPSGDGLSPYY